MKGNKNTISIWRRCALGHPSVSDINPSGENKKAFFFYIDLESVSQGKLTIEKKLNIQDAPSRAQRIVRRRDILFQLVRPYQRNNLFFDKKSEYQFIASTGYALIRAKQDPKYLYYFLHTDDFVSMVEAYCTGSNYPAITSEKLSIIPVVFPEDIHDQQHIADILTSCDEVIEQTEKAIEKYRSIKAGMLQDLFTRGVDANGRLRPKPEDAPELYKDSPLGKIPKEWDIMTVCEFFDIEVGGDLQKDCFSSYKTAIHKYPIFSNALEHGGLYGYTTTPNYPAESITLTGRGSLGHAEYRTEPFDAIIRLVVLKTKKDLRVNCKFIAEQLNYDQDFFIESTGVPQLTAPQSAKMRVRIPKTEEEQRNIALRFSSIDDRIALEKQILDKYRFIKLALMKKLLTPPEGALEA